MKIYEIFDRLTKKERELRCAFIHDPQNKDLLKERLSLKEEFREFSEHEKNRN